MTKPSKSDQFQRTTARDGFGCEAVESQHRKMDSEIAVFPMVGESLEESPEALLAAARPIAYGSRKIVGLTQAEADAFVAALDEA